MYESPGVEGEIRKTWDEEVCEFEVQGKNQEGYQTDDGKDNIPSEMQETEAFKRGSESLMSLHVSTAVPIYWRYIWATIYWYNRAAFYVFEDLYLTLKEVLHYDVS